MAKLCSMGTASGLAPQSALSDSGARSSADGQNVNTSISGTGARRDEGYSAGVAMVMQNRSMCRGSQRVFSDNGAVRPRGTM